MTLPPDTPTPRHPGTQKADSRYPSIKHDDAAGNFAAAHGLEALVDVVEGDAARDELVKLQAATEIEVDVARHVDAEAVGPHVGALDLLFVQEFGAGELDPLPLRDHADDRGCAALAEHGKRLLRRDLEH